VYFCRVSLGFGPVLEDFGSGLEALEEDAEAFEEVFACGRVVVGVVGVVGVGSGGRRRGRFFGGGGFRSGWHCYSNVV